MWILIYKFNFVFQNLEFWISCDLLVEKGHQLLL